MITADLKFLIIDVVEALLSLQNPGQAEGSVSLIQ